MERKEIKYVGLRVTPEMHRKLRFVAEYEGRTINGQVIYLMNQCVRDFEKEHGPIRDEEEK